MKTTVSLLSAGIITAFCGAVGHAQIVYSNNFSLGDSGTLNGTAPTVANDYAGGSSSADWYYVGVNDAFRANGAVAGTADTALLDFTPQSGYLYTLALNMTLPADMGGVWIAAGFSTNNDLSGVGQARFTDPNGAGVDWALIRTGGTGASSYDQYFSGPRTTQSPSVQINPNEDLVSVAGTYTLEINLDTRGAQWIDTAYIIDSSDNVIDMGTYTYSSNPAIASVGIGNSNAQAGTTLNWLSLTAAPVPEPSTFALAGLGAGAWLARRRRKQA